MDPQDSAFGLASDAGYQVFVELAQISDGLPGQPVDLDFSKLCSGRKYQPRLRLWRAGPALSSPNLAAPQQLPGAPNIEGEVTPLFWHTT